MFRVILTASLAAVLMLTASHAFAMTIFVSNEKDNTITVIDGDTLGFDQPETKCKLQ